ncbi:MAG: Outer rane lipoprotein Blc [Cyanobacteriota bacterium]
MPWCEGLTDAPPPAPGAGGENADPTLDRQQDKAAASLEPVSAVDLNRYVGLWHEIARIPNRFQRQCVRDSLAVYTLRGDGSIAVLNLCVKRNGAVDQARGVARVVDRISQARLKVSLVSVLGWRPFWGDYWIIGLDPDYRWAIVGEARRRFGWILARTPSLEPTSWTTIQAILERNGYDKVASLPGDFQAPGAILSLRQLDLNKGHRLDLFSLRCISCGLFIIPIPLLFITNFPLLRLVRTYFVPCLLGVTLLGLTTFSLSTGSAQAATELCTFPTCAPGTTMSVGDQTITVISSPSLGSGRIDLDIAGSIY